MKNKISFASGLTKFGIGLFETIKVYQGNPLLLEEHLDRLYSSLSKLEIPFKFEKEQLEKEILDYCQPLDNKALRVTVCDEGYNFSLRDIPYGRDDYKRGYRVALAPFKRGESPLYNHKTANYYENILVRRDALDNGYDEVLFVRYDNKVLEGTTTNIFFVKGDCLYTPKEDLGLLPGILRAKVIELAKGLGIEVRLMEIDISEISNYDFAFATNSLVDMIRIRSIEELRYDSRNKIFDKIRESFNKKAYPLKLIDD
ncbi:aminotransferase class IV [Halonatronum saccharophilum]|uniref:aminotransferase class IV n=1 Tax=Halonatronum saccharophilum TaxID=150060 RepID=UPI0004B55CC9|nr:aminotransferase class IV [Halonatronum saccharophilum]